MRGTRVRRCSGGATPRRLVLAVAATVALGGVLAGCSAYDASSSAGTYSAPPPFPHAPAHPTDAEQSATLHATEAYRRYLLTHAEHLTTTLWGLANAARKGDVVLARRDEVVAQGDFDAFRPDLAPYSATSLALDAEPWAQRAARPGGLHGIERDLWHRVDSVGASRLAAGLVETSVEVAYSFSREVLSPAQILGQGVTQLQWAVSVPVVGREEEFSHLDLVDVDGAVGAASEAFGLVAPLGGLVAPEQTALVRARLEVLDHALAGLGDPSARPDATIPLREWQLLAVDLDGADAPMATLAGDVEGFGSGRLYP